MLGSVRRGVKAAALFLILTGCLGSRLERAAAAHVDVLTGTARKGADLVASGRLTAENMPELTYPLERAASFARTVRARGAPAWLPAFDDLVGRYRDFVDTLDRIRREERGAAATAALREPLAAVDETAERVRAALRSSARE
jgi:hypothetical protein